MTEEAYSSIAPMSLVLFAGSPRSTRRACGGKRRQSFPSVESGGRKSAKLYATTPRARNAPIASARAGASVTSSSPARPSITTSLSLTVVIVEDEDAVVPVVLRDVRRRDPVRALDPAEGVRRRPALRMAERVATRLLDRLARVRAALHLGRAARAKVVEQGALERHEVRHSHDGLRDHRVDRAELLRDPLAHLGGRIETADRRGHRGDALRRGPGRGVERGEALLELDDGHRPWGVLGGRSPPDDGHAARRAFDAAR